MALRDWFIKDLGWKLFSVVLAVTIWVTVNYKDESPSAPRRQNIYSDLPVMAVSLSAGQSAEISPSTVTVTVSGSSETMAVLQANQIRAIVNLSGLASGSDLRRSVEVAVPPGVAVVNVDPADVTVTVSQPAGGE
jgi:YbbR domain-containing protein